VSIIDFLIPVMTGMSVSTVLALPAVFVVVVMAMVVFFVTFVSGGCV